MKIIEKHFDEIGSTNSYLLEQDIKENELWLCVADKQTSGRGQGDKIWVSPAGGNLYISLGWLTSDIKNYPQNFSEEIGHCCKNIIEKLINKEGFIRIKKPNDLYIANQKLGGILVETKVKNNFNAKIVVGIGINLNHAIPGACALSDYNIVLDRHILKRALLFHFKALNTNHVKF